MNPTATLEAPVIEDTLFGEDLATEVKNEEAPTCICSCPDRPSRATNNAVAEISE